MGSLITLLIVLVVFSLLYYACTLLPIPAPIKTVALVVFLVIFALYLLQTFGLLGGGSPRLLRGGP